MESVKLNTVANSGIQKFASFLKIEAEDVGGKALVNICITSVVKIVEREVEDVESESTIGTGNNVAHSIAELNSMIASKTEEIQNLEEKETKLINENYKLK